MRFQVLGPVTACNVQGPVALGSARQRAVLAVLLTELSTMVSIDQLVDRVWGPAPPKRARPTLHTYLSRLRGTLSSAGGPVLLRRALSYRLEVDADAVDLHRFRTLVAEARQRGDGDAAVTRWQEAMGLWQGRPFVDLDSDWLQQVAVGLEMERQAAWLDYTEVQLRRGEHARLLPDLTAATREHPLDERLAGQLMLALYQCGRQADALACYRQLHDRLVSELGSDPGPAVRELHQRMLRQDVGLAGNPRNEAELAGSRTELASPTPATSGAAAAGPVRLAAPGVPGRPAQLPADVTGFTGRAGALRRLDEVLGENAAGQTGRAVVVTAIGGTAGVGKTALAVHWAHRVADRFPDGQLYVNLRGYDPSQPVPPGEALTRLLAALGVTGNDVPIDLDDRAARYRSEVAGRRLLIMLDNAASVAQVRPLLPGSSSCAVVVTSRDSLAGLVAVHGAHRIDLDLFPQAEAVELLRHLIGARVLAEPEAAAALAQQCARLPLALRVAAELAAGRPDEPLAELVAELADRQQRLARLDVGGDPHAAVQTVFSWSILHLSPAAVETFRLLGLHPGPDFDSYALAALAGTELPAASQALAELARAHLVHRTGPSRYGMHDLLRAFALHLVSVAAADESRSAALTRMYNYYQAAATGATNTLYPEQLRPDEIARLAAGGGSAVSIPDLSQPVAAQAWLEVERVCLAASAAHAAAEGSYRYPVDLAMILYEYLDGGPPAEALAINGHALHAAEQAGDLVGQAHSLRRLGVAYSRVGHYQQAIDHVQRALACFRDAGDRVGQAQALGSLGVIAKMQGNLKRAVDDHTRALALTRQSGDRRGEARALSNVANVESSWGRLELATDHHRQAIAIYRELGLQASLGTILNNLAMTEMRMGEYLAARDHLRQALAILEQLGSPHKQACTLDSLGDLYLRLGDPAQAQVYFQQALARFRQAGVRVHQAHSLNGLGEAAHLAGQAAESADHHTEALAVAVEFQVPTQQARAHTGLGHACRTRGDLAAARSHYEQAYAVFSELDLPEAEEVLAYLTGALSPQSAAAAG